MRQSDHDGANPTGINRRTVLKGAIATPLLSSVGSFVANAEDTDTVARIGSASASTTVWNGPLSETKLTASNGDDGDQFGSAVATDNGSIVVGSWYDDDPHGYRGGSAYVFTRTGGSWTEEAKLTVKDGDRADQFGTATAIDGDTIVVGAQGDEDPTGGGSAYVFRQTGGSWSQEAKLVASDGDNGDQFGSAVAIDGGTVVVGAHSDEDPNGGGSAYVFTRSGGSWSQQTKLAASDGDSGDSFGQSVAIYGDTVAVGDPGDDDPNGHRSGSAYVFTRTSGTWSQEANLSPSDLEAFDHFGSAVAIDGDTLLVGAHFHDDPNGYRAGAVYEFRLTNGSWTMQDKFGANDGDRLDHFGVMMAMDGDSAIIGARKDEDPNGSKGGSAYVFAKSDGSWSQQAKLAASDGEPRDILSRVAIAGDTAVAGALADDNSNGRNAGSAYVYEPANQPPNATFSVITDPPVANESVTFDASGSTDPDGSIASYAWDFDDDGTFEVTTADPIITHTFDTGGEKSVSLRVSDDRGATDTTTREFTVWIRTEIDIKPCSDPNAINPNAKGVLPVGVKQTSEFDPTKRVAVDTLRFGAPDAVKGGDGSTAAHGGHFEDVVPCGGDGRTDLVLHFPVEATGFEGDEKTGRLAGVTENGIPLYGSDSVKLVGGGGGSGGNGSGGGPP